LLLQGLVDTLCKTCLDLKWKEPTRIQQEAIPLTLQGNLNNDLIIIKYCKVIINYFLLIGKDVIGLAETGSGKTAAFALPILQALLENPQRYFALILTPTRELAFQISEQFDALGKNILFCLINGFISYYNFFQVPVWV